MQGEHPDGRARGHDVLELGLGLAALAMLVLSPWLVDSSGPDPFYKGPLIFPLVVLALAFAAAVPAAWRMLRRRPGLYVDGGGLPRRAGALLALMCLFPPAIAAIGLQLSTFLLALAGLLILRTSPARALTSGLVLSMAIHLAFRTFLDIWFPTPWLLPGLGL